MRRVRRYPQTQNPDLLVELLGILGNMTMTGSSAEGAAGQIPFSQILIDYDMINFLHNHLAGHCLRTRTHPTTCRSLAVAFMIEIVGDKEAVECIDRADRGPFFGEAHAEPCQEGRCV